jgi:sugar phosphate isomerase/epimerase
MQLAVSGEIVPRDLHMLDDRSAAKIAELGFRGVGAHFLGDPETLPRESLRRARQIFADHGLQIVQLAGWHPLLVHADASVRRAGVRTLQHALRAAADCGAQMVISGPGSLNPRGHWWPHPGNHTPAAEDALVASLREAVGACEEHGVPIALECHVTSTLDTPTRVRRVVERVGSPWIKVNLDPVNFISDLQTLYNTSSLLNDLFDVLGPYIVAAHIKDAYAENRLVVHISETVPGDGLLDFSTFFRRFEALLPNGYAIIEHLPESQVAQARAFVAGKLAELNHSVEATAGS